MIVLSASATMKSTKPKPARRRWFKYLIPHIILESIFGDKGSCLAMPEHLGGRPVNIDENQFEVVRIIRDERRIGDREVAGVLDAAVRVRDGVARIIIIVKNSGDKTGGPDLVPRVQTDGLGLLRQDLRRTKIFPRQSDDPEAGGYAG